MIIVGEKLNSSIRSAREAMAARDEKRIVRLMRAQADAGADYLDLNAAALGAAETETLIWLVKLARENTEAGLMLDSPDAKVLRRVAEHAEGRKLIFNSVTLLRGMDELPNLAAEMGAGIVALPMGAKMPESAEERLDIARDMVEKIESAGVPRGKIYVDVLTEALSGAEENGARASIDAISLIRENIAGVGTIAGVSNSSFGLPRRPIINAAYIALAAYTGLTAAIIDPMSEPVMSSLRASLALAGDDEFSMDYIRYCRKLSAQ